MFKDKKILLLGFAREGVSTLLYLRNTGNSSRIDIYDKKRLPEIDDKWQRVIKSDTNHRLFLGEDIAGFLSKTGDSYDLIIKTAGIPNKYIPRELLPKITTQTNIFFQECRGLIIGITGTKGKSTTSSLIYEILKLSGRKTVFVGNIGKPCLESINDTDKNTTVVFELSSHQLSTLNQSPHIAVLLNIFQEHLDYYESFDDYVSAKENIVKFQKKDDFLIYNGIDRQVLTISSLSAANKIDFSKSSIPVDISDTKLKGAHNLNNIRAAWCAGRVLGIDEETIKKALISFSPLRHRLELVGTYKGVTFYNDSLATIPEATISALDALGGNVETLITGGFDRGLSYKKIAGRILESRIKNLILFPTTGEIIWHEIGKLSDKNNVRINHYFAGSMEKAVELSLKYTDKGKICLLSCASSSFNLFKDYQDRGDQFIKFIRSKS